MATGCAGPYELTGVDGDGTVADGGEERGLTVIRPLDLAGLTAGAGGGLNGVGDLEGG